MKQNSKLAVLRTMACKAWPRASYAILSMRPVERPGLQTMSVDQHWRLYYDPKWIEKESPDKLTGVIVHEVCHLLLKHHARAIKVVEDTAENWHLWNIAADAAINQMIFASGMLLPDGVVTPESIQLPPGKSAEFYYRELVKRRDEEKQKQQEQQEQAEKERQQQEQEQDDEPDDQPSDDGSDDGDQSEPEGQDDGDDPADSDSQADESTDGDDGHPDDSIEPGDQPTDEPGGDQPSDQPGDEPGDAGQDGEPAADQDTDGQPGQGTGLGDQDGDDWDGSPAPDQGGSCSDGQRRPWELPAPDDDDDQTLDEFDQDSIIKQVAEAIEKHGSDKGYLSTFCDEVLRPKVDPKRLLMTAIRRHTDNIINGGDGKYTYRRPSRRPSSTGMIRPRSFQVIPKIKILIDTSGSMDKSDYMRAMGLVSKCLSSLRCRDGIEVVTGDTRDAWAGKVFDHSKIQLCGGGGTDMGYILTKLDEDDDKTDLIICVTDGYTPWPQEKLKTPIVVCLTREPSTLSFYKVPTWMKSVQI